MEHLNKFIQLNFVGPVDKIESINDKEFSLNIDTNNESFILNLKRADLLCDALNELREKNMDRLLCLFVLQQCLVEPSENVYEEILNTYGFTLNRLDSDEEKIKLYILRFYIELYHTKTLQITKKQTFGFLDKAIALSGLKIDWVGVKGRRTKFQQDSHLQLVLKVTRSHMLQVANEATQSQLPENILLNNEVLLENLSLDEEQELLKLSPLEQSLLLAKATAMFELQAKEDIVNEEIMPVLRYVLTDAKNWSVTSFALLLRSRIEMSKVKTMERSLLQYEQLGSQFESGKEGDSSVDERLQFFNILGIPNFSAFQMEIADHYLNFGALKSALVIFQQFKAYEKVILCLKSMDLNKEAEQYIVENMKTEKLSKMTYAKLLCYLGDCRNDHTLYLKAWEHSEKKLSLSQFRLANFYFKQEKFQASLDCYVTGLSINPLKPKSWFIAGCCALKLEKYEEAASCFKRVTSMDENYEAWNNLATALLQLNKDAEAHFALQQAVKESTSWKVWMNYLYVSLICNDLQEAIRAGIKVLDMCDIDWGTSKEQPEFNYFNHLITKVMDEIKRKDDEFLEERIFELGNQMIEKSPCYLVWTSVSRLYVGSKNFDTAFKLIECGYRDLKDNSQMYYDEKRFLQFCELGLELIRISNLDKGNEVLTARSKAICRQIISYAKLTNPTLDHLKELV
eukprot:NODE_14_length_51535_cov_1.125049.p5 type:complete len:683 gc:universal NODE_14_length_51535_cov_1.125049:31617-33665(+)